VADRHSQMKPFQEALREMGVDVILFAHQRNYEWFLPRDPYGRRRAPSMVPASLWLTTASRATTKSGVPWAAARSMIKPSACSPLCSYDWWIGPVKGDAFNGSRYGWCH